MLPQIIKSEKKDKYNEVLHLRAVLVQTKTFLCVYVYTRYSQTYT